MVQYPHTGVVWEAPEGTKDSKGNLISGEALLQFETDCRIEPNLKSQFINGADGNKIVFKGIIYMPLADYRIKPGANLKVYDGATLISDETVLQFSKGQLNMRAWV